MNNYESIKSKLKKLLALAEGGADGIKLISTMIRLTPIVRIVIVK